jgi:hypothetical protein
MAGLAVAVALIVGATLLLGEPSPNADAATMLITKKVRITNNTADTGIRAMVVHFNPRIRFWRDVPRNQQKLVSGVDIGHRGVIVWEDLNEEIIATGKFELTSGGKNVDVIVSGDQEAGYQIGFAEFD